MKVIDLFKNISDYDTYFGRNDGSISLPDKIKVSDYEYKLDIDDGSYNRKDRDGEYTIGLLEDINLHNTYLWFNLEVEIIEEDKEIEKIPLDYTRDRSQLEIYEYLRCVINEIIKEVNKIKKEGK